MAKIRVYRDECDGDEFPNRCIRCGVEPDGHTSQNFAWMPPWLIVLIFFGWLPYLIVVLVMRKTMRVTMPVCSTHRGHWRNRKLFVWLGLLFWIAYGIGLTAIWSSLGKDACMAGLGILLFGGLLWLIVAAVYSSSGIRPGIITNGYIELVRVDRDFADEWNDSEPKPKKHRHDEDDDDD